MALSLIFFILISVILADLTRAQVVTLLRHYKQSQCNLFHIVWCNKNDRGVAPMSGHMSKCTNLPKQVKPTVKVEHRCLIIIALHGLPPHYFTAAVKNYTSQGQKYLNNNYCSNKTTGEHEHIVLQ